MIENLTQYGSMIMSAGMFVYLFSAKIHNIKSIEKSVGEIKEDLKTFESRQIKHESRLSYLEGKQNGACK